MLDRLVIEPMGEERILWRCLHGGSICAANVDEPRANPQVDWPAARARNVPLLRKLTQVYGACAITARDGPDVVGTLRFYPRALCAFGESGAGFCLQQKEPYGPAADMAASDFPPLRDLVDKTIFVHCLLVVSPVEEPDRYRRKGVARGLARELVRWAGEQGWHAIEANAYEEIPLLYEIAGVAGRSFWQKLGFTVVTRDTESAMSGEFYDAILKSALSAGIPAENVADRYRMRLQLVAD